MQRCRGSQPRLLRLRPLLATALATCNAGGFPQGRWQDETQRAPAPRAGLLLRGGGRGIGFGLHLPRLSQRRLQFSLNPEWAEINNFPGRVSARSLLLTAPLTVVNTKATKSHRDRFETMPSFAYFHDSPARLLLRAGSELAGARRAGAGSTALDLLETYFAEIPPRTAHSKPIHVSHK